MAVNSQTEYIGRIGIAIQTEHLCTDPTRSATRLFQEAK